MSVRLLTFSNTTRKMRTINYLSPYRFYVESEPEAPDAKYKRELKSEERRAVVLLGFLGAVVAFDFWLRDRPESDPKTFNFICNYPCPHVTFPWLPFLDTLTLFWFAWAACMLIYFSEDVFHSWAEMSWVRRYARNLGHGFLILWPTWFWGLVIWSEGLFLIEDWVPPWVQFLYVLLEAYFLVLLIVWFLETITMSDDRIIRRLTGFEYQFARAMPRTAYSVGKRVVGPPYQWLRDRWRKWRHIAPECP